MPRSMNSEPRLVGDDLVFDTYEESSGAVRVTVSREALEDYADPRGIKGNEIFILRAGLEDILNAVEMVLKRHKTTPAGILITTADLNG